MHPLKFFSEKYKTFRLPVLTVPNPKMFTFTVIYGKDEPSILTFEILKQGASLKHLQNKHNRANCQLYYKTVHGTTYANKVFISSPLCCISSFSAQCQWCAQDAMPQLLMIFCFHIVIAVLGHGGIAFKHTSAVCWILTFLKVFSISLVQRKRCTSGMFSSWTVWLLIICGLPVVFYFPLVFILPLICGYRNGRLNSVILCLLQWRLCNHMWQTVVVPVAQTPVKPDMGLFRGSRLVNLCATVLWIHILKGAIILF